MGRVRNRERLTIVVDLSVRPHLVVGKTIKELAGFSPDNLVVLVDLGPREVKKIEEVKEVVGGVV